jgi:hypothetical protein
MKIRFVHIGLPVAIIMTLLLTLVARRHSTSAAEALAEDPEPALPIAQPTAGSTAALTPDARAAQDRLAFERETRAFLRDAARMDEAALTVRSKALNLEIERREQSGALSSDEAMMLRIGLIYAAVKDNAERVRQARGVAEHYRRRNAERQAAQLARQQREEQNRQYRAAEARIVSEVLAMQSYPDGMSRDAYLRQRLQQAHEAIYGTANATQPR